MYSLQREVLFRGMCILSNRIVYGQFAVVDGHKVIYCQDEQKPYIVWGHSVSQYVGFYGNEKSSQRRVFELDVVLLTKYLTGEEVVGTIRYSPYGVYVETNLDEVYVKLEDDIKIISDGLIHVENNDKGSNENE